MNGDSFDGFPSSATGTAIPNLFFSRVLPTLETQGALLAFLWLSKLTQAIRGPLKAATADDIWADDGAAAAFEALGDGRQGLEKGLEECERAKALISLSMSGRGGSSRHYFVNNPASRSTIARVKAGELQLRPSALPSGDERPAAAPGIFRLYEEHFGTITPFVGERLLQVAETYPEAWVEEAVREAALVQTRNWRYVERILERWMREGRVHETPGRDSLEEQKQRFLGGRYGHIARSS